MIRTAQLLSAMIFVVGCAKERQPDAQLVFDLQETEFAEFSAEATLEAIGSISEAADSPIRVGFRIDRRMRNFIFSTGEIFFRWGISVEPPHFKIHYDGITHNGEKVSFDEANRRFKKYAEAARLTGSKFVFSVSASPGVKNSALTRLLDLLAEEEIVHLITEPGEAVVANPHPRRIGTPHEIRPSDLFQTGDH